MKKTLLLGVTLLSGLFASAQLNNVTAPDFTTTDINNVQHSLSDYLNEGKIVIMDISAAWCGPCWSFHQSHALADLYNTYGPGGSDEVVVLFVEGDASTPLENIYGNGTSPAGAPQGDWTEGGTTPYPIIDDASIANSYQINAYPTVFMICPDTGKVFTINRGDLDVLVSQISSVCNASVEGLPDFARVKGNNKLTCDSDAGVPVTIGNLGSTITSATVALKEGETVVATQTFDLNIAPGQEETVVFDGQTLTTEGVTYTAELTQVNNNAPYSSSVEYTVTDEFMVAYNPETLDSFNNIRVKVKLDYYPGDVLWAIIDGNGNAVHVQQYAAPSAGGGPYALTTQVHDIVLPEGVNCYDIYVYDSYGDGLDYISANQHGNPADFGITVYSGAPADLTNIIYEHDGDYVQIYEPAYFKTTGVLGNEEFTADSFAIYPNPTSGILNFATQETVDVTIVDLQGKVVFTAKNINNGDSINLSTLQTGLYIAKINGENSERVEKVVIK